MNGLATTLLPMIGTTVGIVGFGGFLCGRSKTQQKHRLEAELTSLRKQASGLQTTVHHASRQVQTLTAEVAEHRIEKNRAATLQAQVRALSAQLCEVEGTDPRHAGTPTHHLVPLGTASPLPPPPPLPAHFVRCV